MRANVAKPAPPGLVDDHAPVDGSNRSAPSVAVVPSLLTLDPPCTKTLPFGRSTELPSTRAPEGISPTNPSRSRFGEIDEFSCRCSIRDATAQDHHACGIIWR